MSFCEVSYSGAVSIAVHSNHFLKAEQLSDRKLLLTGHTVAQNYVFVVFQTETTKNKSHDYLARHVKETIVMKILQQLITNVNYMA